MAEKIKAGVGAEKPKGHIRGIWAILIIIILAILVLGGVGYYFYKTDPTYLSGLFEKKKASTPAPSSTATPTSSAAPGSCTPGTLSTEEQAIITGWGTHTNTAGKFEFKYPPTWTATAEYLDMVRMQDSEDANIKFKFGRAEAGTADVSGFSTPNTTSTSVYCIEATKKVYEKGSSSPYDYLVVVSFERFGIPNILTYEFKAEGASIAGDYIDQFSALIKTFKFL